MGNSRGFPPWKTPRGDPWTLWMLRQASWTLILTALCLLVLDIPSGQARKYNVTPVPLIVGPI